MATKKINSDSSVDYTIPTEEFLVKLRKNLDGVALSHDALDNNWEVLRRSFNDLWEEVDAITNGDLGSVTTENLYVSKIKDNIIGTNHIIDGAVTSSKIADGAVGSSKIASNAITVDKIANGTITTDKIASGSTLDFSNGISVNGTNVVDKDGKIVGEVSLTTAQKAELKGDQGVPGATPTFSYAGGVLTITNA